MKPTRGRTPVPAREMEPKAPRVDWESVEREYRVGQISIRQIARINKCSEALIRQHAKRNGWSRDLTEAVKVSVQQKLTVAALDGDPAAAADREAESRLIIEAAALRGVEVITGHRRSIARAHKNCAQMMADLELISENAELIGDIIKTEKTEVKRRRLSVAITVQSRSLALVNIVTALKAVIALERQAFNLNTGPDEASSSDDKAGAPVIYLPSNGRDDPAGDPDE